jgi:hypothetical protein
MKLRVIGSKDKIARLDPKERVVHLTIPPIALTFLEVISRCPNR